MSETKLNTIPHKLMIKPDLPLESIPTDAVIYDLILFYLYWSAVAKTPRQQETMVTIGVPDYDRNKHLSLDEFKELGYIKNKAILDMLCKYGYIKSYKMQFTVRSALGVQWGRTNEPIEQVDFPFYKVECKLIPAEIIPYVETRFALFKSYFEEVEQVYSRIVQIVEDFFTEPVKLDPILNRFYKSLKDRLYKLFEKNIRPCNYIELALPFEDLIFEQYQIAAIMQNRAKYLNPFKDNHALLQQWIGMYDLENPSEASFNEIDEHLGSAQLSNEREVMEPEQKQSGKVKYVIKYLPTREIVLNNEYYLAQPDFNRENDKFFEFIFNRPDISFSKEQIENEIKTKIYKKLHQVVYELGFKGALRKMFFPKVSQKAVAFRNNLTDQDVKELGIEQQLSQELKELTRFVPVRNSQER